MTEDDLNLIRDARRGKVEAFARLVRNYKNYVYGTVLGVLQNRSDAEDVTQETFLKVHQSLKGLRDERTFPAWIARIAVRASLDYATRHERHKAALLDDEQLVSPGDIHHLTHLRLDLEHAMADLSYDQRTILVLRELQGYNYEELAEILDIPIGTVRSRLHHARMELRKRLVQEGGDLP